MPGRGLASIALALALLTSICLAVAPQASGSYKIKRGQAASNEVTMAEFQVSFDQDLHLLEFQDCPGVPSGPCPPVNVSECPPCDYASTTSCGTIRETRNRTDQACIDKCAQNAEWCDPTNTFGPWKEINIGDTVLGRGPSFGGNPPFITFRLYVPEGQFCNFSIFIRQTLGTVMLHAGDLLISRTPLNATEAFLTNSRMPWLAAGADVLNSDNVHVCPTDFSPIPGFYTDEAGAGTYFIILIGPQIYNLSVSKIPIAPPLPDEDMSWCDSATLPAPFNVSASVFAPAPGSFVDDIFTDGEIHCIANDRLYEFYMPSGSFSTLVVLLARVDGPCPRMFGITQTDDNSAAFSEIYASSVTPYPTFDDLRDLGEPAILMDHDFPKRSLVWSFCPSDTTKPTYIAISIWSGGPQRIFYSTNPARFRATRFDDVGSPQELAYVATSAMTLKFPGGGYNPDCSLRCVYASSPCACAFASGPMSPLTEPSPLWPYPRWYISILGRENLAQSFTPEYLRTIPFNGSRSMYMSLLMTTTSFLENGTATKTYFTEDQVAQAYVGFYGQFSVVNANFEAPMPDFLSSLVPAPYKRVTLPCTEELFTTARASVDKVLPSLLNVSTDLSEVNIELDVLNFVDGFVGCTQKADALLVERNVTRLVSTVDCLSNVFSSQIKLPCCSPEADWSECCLPSLANVSDVSYSLPSADSLLSQCEDPACLNTYLSDYLLQRETSCATALPRNAEWSLSSCWEPHMVCERAVYGDNLVGVPCVTDADCGINGFCSEPALPGISQGDPYETFSRPRGVRRTCRVPRANLTEAYLNCLVAIRSPAMIQMLDSKYPAATYAQSVQLLLSDAQFRVNMCVAAAGIAPEPGFGTYYKRGNNPIGSLCPQGFDQWSIFYERTYAVVDYWRRGPDDYCGVFPDWFPISPDQATCEGRLTCNWLDCVSKNIGDSACQTACLSPTGVCAICRSDGSCFDDFATIDASATDNVTCLASHACQLANGSIVSLDPATCAQTYSCSHPCWNANTQSYEPCAGEAACIGSGECDDELFHNPLTGEDSSCVIGMSDAISYFKQNCALMVSGEFGVDTVVGDTTGCVIWDVLNQQDCAALDGASTRLVNPVWRTRARTRLECEGSCGCVKDATWHPSPSRPNITDTWPSSPSECAACTPAQECSPYHSWTQARWARGDPRPLRWVDAPAMVPAYTWASDQMDFGLVKSLIDQYCEVGGVAYRNRALTAADCRFGRAAAALQAVACGCDSSNTTGSCYGSIGSTARVGIAAACPLVPATLIVPPHTITFASESVPLSARCQNLEFFASPLASYRSSAPAQRLSTYFSPKSQTRSRQDFEFLNSHDAVVGEVIAEGITLRSNVTFYNVTFCLSLGSFDASLSNFDLERFDFLDLALAPNPSTVVPLEVATSIRNGGYCARVSEVPPNATVVAILRIENWRDARKPGLTRGEKTVLALVAAAYFICAIAYGPYYCLSFLRVNGWRVAVTVSLFWLPILLGVSNILRGIYFALLGSGVLANSTYVDVLLVELPTFIWFTATLMMVLFWLVLLASIWNENARIRRLKRAFWITFIIANVVMYALFIAFVVVFSQLDETVEKTKCSGRLQSDVVRRPKRIAFIVYQSFLAGVTILLALAYLIGGLLLGRKLRSVRVEEANRKNTKQIWRLVLVACVVSVAVALHALFIFLLAITQPGIPYLALVLLVLDVVPTAVLLWSLPAPTTDISTTSGSRSSGLHSRQSVVSEL